MPPKPPPSAAAPRPKSTIGELNDTEVRAAAPRARAARRDHVSRPSEPSCYSGPIIHPSIQPNHPSLLLLLLFSQEYLVSKGFESNDLASCKKYLAMVSEHAARRPGPTRSAASRLLADPKRARLSKLDEYEHLEQLALASLDLGALEDAESACAKLYDAFPGSARVGRLAGMIMEASGRHDEALKHYENVLEKHPADQRVMKRKAACRYASGDLPGAIEELVKYLDVFMADVDAWDWLADLYVAARRYDRAIFCLEEVVVARPSAHRFHRKIADAYYAVGGDKSITSAEREDALNNARKYYAAAVDQSIGRDVRALYGLTQVDARLKSAAGKKGGGGGGGGGGETASHTTPFAWCTPFLKDFSRRHSSPAFPFQRLTGKTFD